MKYAGKIQVCYVRSTISGGPNPESVASAECRRKMLVVGAAQDISINAGLLQFSIWWNLRKGGFGFHDLLVSGGLIKVQEKMSVS